MSRHVELAKIRERVERSIASYEGDDDDGREPLAQFDAERTEQDRLVIEAMLLQYKALCTARSSGLQSALSSMTNVARTAAADVRATTGDRDVSGGETDFTEGEGASGGSGDEAAGLRRQRLRELPSEDSGMHMQVWAKATGTKLEHAHRLGVQALVHQLDLLRAMAETDGRRSEEDSSDRAEAARMLEQMDAQRLLLLREHDALQGRTARLEQALADRDSELATLREGGALELRTERERRLVAEENAIQAAEASMSALGAADAAKAAIIVAEERVNALERQLNSRNDALSANAEARKLLASDNELSDDAGSSEWRRRLVLALSAAVREGDALVDGMGASLGALRRQQFNAALGANVMLTSTSFEAETDGEFEALDAQLEVTH